MPKSLHANFRNSGFSTGETIIAISLLAILVGVVGTFSSYVREGVDNLRFQKLIQWEIQNTRERISTWPVQHITQENVSAIEISAEITEQLSEARWNATVSPTTIQPIGSSTSTPAISIQLRLTGKYKGQQITPSEIQFWVLTESTDQQSATKQQPVTQDPVSQEPTPQPQSETNSNDNGKEKIEATR